ncbi:signal peptidase I [Nocardioides dongkuii]|uniref:signal peptidase I n=1 Tax=Nocardioides dongkuii TaxID=2760089 RepID=UPI001877E4BE|nr:signal peptidase I [Nocardioides dongkuii]
MSSLAWDPTLLRVAPRPTGVSASQRQARGRRFLGFAAQVTGWLLIIALLLVLAATVLVPRVAGATPYTVLTGSMEPNLPPGTLIVTQQVPVEDIEIGEVVTFQIESGKPQVVTHRVIATRQGESGRPEFLTQGDANPIPDEGWRPAESVRGVLWYAVPELGHANNVLTGDQRQLGVYVVAAALVLYALGLFAGDARDRRRTRGGSRAARHAAP